MNVFVAVHGQPDNVGDSVLRRAMLDALRPSGAQLHVLVGQSGAAYTAGLGLQREDVVYTSRKRWQIAGFRDALRRRAAFVSNAGEIQLNSRRVKINLADSLLIALIRAGGRRALQTGMGIRNPEGRRNPFLIAPTMLCNLSTWRDEPSQKYAGRGQVFPDWAFAIEGEAGAHERPLLAITMRGDRTAPDEEWFATVRRMADGWSLTPIVVTQVERDSDNGRLIAEALGAEFIPYPTGTPHDEQERIVRQVYARSGAVVSDRLHALILGASEGAPPIGLCIGSDDKIGRTFAGAGFPRISVSQSDTPNGELSDQAMSLRLSHDDLITHLTTARGALERLTTRLQSDLATNQRSRKGRQ